MLVRAAGNLDGLIEQAFAHVRALPTTPPPPMPDHSVLEEIIAASAVPQG